MRLAKRIFLTQYDFTMKRLHKLFKKLTNIDQQNAAQTGKKYIKLIIVPTIGPEIHHNKLFEVNVLNWKWGDSDWLEEFPKATGQIPVSPPRSTHILLFPVRGGRAS